MITFENVTKRFGDGTVALDNVSFHIEPGELVVVTGPSGAGKTSIMKLLIHDFLPTEGEIVYKGESVTKMPEKEVPFHRRKIGVVFQDYRLLPELNVWENIALPLSILGKSDEEIESRVTDLLSLIGISDRALVFPKQLSGGEAQRVSIARALATGPSVIFADEPTGNLDKEASLGIVKLLEQINKLGTTVLIATHDVTLLDYLENERQLALQKGILEHDSRPGKPKPLSLDEEPAKEKIEKSAEPEAKEEKPEKPAKKLKKKEDKKKSKEEKVDKSSKEEAEKEDKETKTEDSEDLAKDFHPIDLTEPAKKAGSWLKKVGSKLPSISLPKLPKKPQKTVKKPMVDEVLPPNMENEE